MDRGGIDGTRYACSVVANISWLNHLWTGNPSHIQLLENALKRIRHTPPRLIASPPTQPRRAAVAIIIHVVPAANSKARSASNEESAQPQSIEEFFAQDWVKEEGCVAELLFIRRKAQNGTGSSADARHPSSRMASQSSFKSPPPQQHVAFPGGKMEAGDEGSLYTGAVLA